MSENSFTRFDLIKPSFILLMLLILFFSIGSISASENVTDDMAAEDPNDIISIEESQDLLSADNVSDKNLASSSDNDNLGASEKSSLFSTNIEYETVTKEYSPKNIAYKVKAYEIWKSSNGKFKKAIKGKVLLKVHVGNSYKKFSKTLKDGAASVKLPALSVGTYKVNIFINGKKQGSSHIKIIKANPKITAHNSCIKYAKNNYYNVKVSDSSGSPVKKLLLKLKVHTGKKIKEYKIQTDSKGIAKLQTKKLSLGTHKIDIETGNKNYAVNTTAKISIKKTSDNVSMHFESRKVLYKKNNCFSVSVSDSFGDPVKNLSVKFKVYTDKKIEKYAVKTDKNGIAKLQTKKLSLGTHKIVIRAQNITENAKIKVVKKLNAPKLISLNHYQDSNGNSYVKLKWNSENSTKYQVLKKSGGKFKVIATVKSNNKVCTYTEKVDYKTSNCYSVREIITNDGAKNTNGPYDKEGVTQLGKPNVIVDFQNMMAKISWSKIAGATKYLVLRKMGSSDSYKCIAKLNSNQLSYTDTYYRSADELKQILTNDIFADPTTNNLVYTVRACSIKNSKTSYGLLDNDGEFHLEAPAIVSLKNKKLTWGSVPNAEGYIILKGVDGVWKELAKVKGKNSKTQSFSLSSVSKKSYYSVQAFAHNNRKLVYSSFDEGFSLMNSSHSKINILYFGDSITYGSPYRTASSSDIFSTPYRVAQLTGCNYYNPSVSGATYHDLGVKNGRNIENTNYYRYRITREVVDPISVGKAPVNAEHMGIDKNSKGETNTCIDDYDIVVLAAGTNDYNDYTSLGKKDSNDTATFHGALNHIISKIEKASENRVNNGKKPIKVIFVDLFYSDRTTTYNVKNNRDVTPNKIGLTLSDYQNGLNEQYSKWSKNAKYSSFYQFKTRDYNIVNENNCPYSTCDNLHLTKFSYGQYGNALAKFIMQKVF